MKNKRRQQRYRSSSVLGAQGLGLLLCVLVASPAFSQEGPTMTFQTGGTKLEIPVPSTALPQTTAAEETAPQMLTLTASKSGEILIPGSFTLSRDAFGKLPLIKANRKLKVTAQAGEDITVVLLGLREGQNPEGNGGGSGGGQDGEGEPLLFEICDTFEAGSEETAIPALTRCSSEGYLVNGGIVAIQKKDDPAYYPLFSIPSRGIVPGSDLGIALNILKQEGTGDGFRYFEGATAYYALHHFNSPLFRLVASLSSMDMDEEVDFETGLGLALMIKTPGESEDPQRPGFSLLVGGGYNFMVHSDDHPWYYFVGFGWNFNRNAL